MLPGFATVIVAVVGFVTDCAGTDACSVLAFTNFVFRAIPFALTIAPETNPVPWTVIVNAGCPGTTLVGLKGW